MSDLYAQYDDWKGWSADSFMTLAPVESAYFAREIGHPIDVGDKVLEIGFGNGAFLAYAKSLGAELYGSELSEQGRDLAARAGVNVVPVDLAQIVAAESGTFALVAAFDVLEHLSPEEIGMMLAEVARLLRPGGRFLARFPNGQSPFGRVYQTGDYTHRTTLSVTMLEQIARPHPLRLVSVGEDLRVVHGGLVRRLKQRALNRIRLFVGSALKQLFSFNAPMGVNVTVVMERTDDRNL